MAYKRDVGSGDQQAQGEATAQNNELAFGKDIAQEVAQNSAIGGPITGQDAGSAAPQDQQQSAPVQYAQGPDPVYQPKNEMDQVLFGDPTGVKPLDTPDKGVPIPQHILRSLPMLSAVVQDPSTPPAIRAAYSFLVQKAAADLERNYA